MNSGEFILEVPAELRMRKNLRRYREIMFAKAMSSAIHECYKIRLLADNIL